MRTILSLWAILTAVGALLLSLPGSDPRIMLLNGQKSPNTVQLAGIGALLLGILVLVVRIILGRKPLSNRLGGRPFITGALMFLCGLGAGVLVASLFAGHWWWWIVGAGLLQLFWLTLLLLAYERKAPTPAPAQPQADAADQGGTGSQQTGA